MGGTIEAKISNDEVGQQRSVQLQEQQLLATDLNTTTPAATEHEVNKGGPPRSLTFWLPNKKVQCASNRYLSNGLATSEMWVGARRSRRTNKIEMGCRCHCCC